MGVEAGGGSRTAQSLHFSRRSRRDEARLRTAGKARLRASQQQRRAQEPPIVFRLGAEAAISGRAECGGRGQLHSPSDGSSSKLKARQQARRVAMAIRNADKSRRLTREAGQKAKSSANLPVSADDRADDDLMMLANSLPSSLRTGKLARRSSAVCFGSVLSRWQERPPHVAGMMSQIGHGPPVEGILIGPGVGRGGRGGVGGVAAGAEPTSERRPSSASHETARKSQSAKRPASIAGKVQVPTNLSGVTWELARRRRLQRGDGGRAYC